MTQNTETPPQLRNNNFFFTGYSTPPQTMNINFLSQHFYITKETLKM